MRKGQFQQHQHEKVRKKFDQRVVLQTSKVQQFPEVLFYPIWDFQLDILITDVRQGVEAFLQIHYRSAWLRSTDWVSKRFLFLGFLIGSS